MSFSQQVVTGSGADGDYVYYNATIVNNTVKTTQVTDDPACAFEDTRLNPLLRDASQYVVSVDNFVLNGATKTLPLLIPQIKPTTLTASVSAATVSADALTIVYTVTQTLVAGQKIDSLSGLTVAGFNVGESILVSSTASTLTLKNVNNLAAGLTSSGTGLLTFPDPADINTTIYTVSFGLQIGTGSGTTTSAGTLSTFLATVPIQWVTENQTPYFTPPATANPRQQESPYYYVYSYQHWLDLLNNALTTAWRDVMYKAQLTIGCGGTQCPFFEFNPATGLFSVCQDSLTSWIPYGQSKQTNTTVTNASAGVSDWTYPFGPAYAPTTTLSGRGQGTAGGTSTGTGTGTAGAVNQLTSLYGEREFSFIGMNTNLEGLMTNFDTVYYGGDAVSLATADAFYYAPLKGVVVAPSTIASGTGTGDWITASTSDPVYYPENVINVIPEARFDSIFILPQPWAVTTVTDVYYIRETQDFISTGTLWSPISSFVLKTSQIPVRMEQMASPVTLGGSSTGGTNTSGAGQRVLLEVPIDCVTADLWRGYVLYKPLTPIFSALDSTQQPLSTIDIDMGWRNRLTNEVVPLRLYNSGTVTFRLRFIRK
jgi:hypothetical protein